MNRTLSTILQKYPTLAAAYWRLDHLDGDGASLAATDLLEAHADGTLDAVAFTAELDATCDAILSRA